MSDIGKFKIVPVSQPKDQSAVVTGTAWQAVNLESYDRCLFIISIGALAGTGASLTPVVKCYSAISGLNASGTAIAGRYKLTKAAFDVSSTTNDAFDDSWTAFPTTGFAITDGTHDGFTMLIEINGAATTNDKPFIGITGTVATQADFISCIAVLTGARYAPDKAAVAA